MKKNPTRRPDDPVMESPSLALTSSTAASLDPGWTPLLARATSQPSPEGGTFTDGLPAHWSATVRRNRWGTWTATGTYSGPEIAQPRVLVSGWCWTRSQAITQVRYWIEDAEQTGRWIKEADALKPGTWWWRRLLSHDADAVLRAAAEEAAYKEDQARRENGSITDAGEAEAAARREDADRTADRLLAAILRESTLANTPLEVQFPDSGYGPHDFPDDHTREAEDRFAEHLRAHPSLRALPKWDSDYVGLDEEAAQDSADLDWEAEDAAAAFDTHENDVAMADAHYDRLEDEHFLLLDWDDAITEDTYRHVHGHAPIEYTDPAVTTTGISEEWADPETDPTQIDWAYRQRQALIPYQVVNGHPLSPGPPAAIARGRNQLGRWGENAMADAVITARTPDGHRHVLLVERDDGNGWALPGGAIEPGETPQDAGVRELHEETGLQIPTRHWQVTQPRFVPDPRGSDEAWAVTVAAHADLGDVAQLPPVRGGDDARQARWVPADTYTTLVAALADQYGGRVFTAHIPMLTELLTSTAAGQDRGPR